MMHRFRTTVTLCLVLSGLVGCSKGQQQRPPAAAPVRVTRVARIDAPVVVNASGVVEPMQSVNVTTEVSGRLLTVAFHEGDYVAQGQVLFRIDPRSLQATEDQARSVLARDEAQAAASARDDERYRTLANMGYVSKSEADQMHATAVAQRATVAADQANLRAAQVSLSYATIRAPISGRTGSLLQKEGNNVSPGGGPLVVINQISPVLVRFPVLGPDFDAMQAALAMHPLHVSAISSDSAQSTDEGTLSFLDNAVDSLTGTVTGKATFPNTARRLWPGELVFLTVTVDVQHNVLAVPTPALQEGQQGQFVYVVDPTKKAIRRPVVVGIISGDFTVIRQGVAAGETVVVDGQSRVNPGGRVMVMKENVGDSSGTSLGGSDMTGGEVVPATGGRGSGGGNGGTTGVLNGVQNSVTNGVGTTNGAQNSVPNGPARGTSSGTQSSSPYGTSTTPSTPSRTPFSTPSSTSSSTPSGLTGANPTPSPTGARGSAGAPGATGAQTTGRPPTGKPPG